MGDRITFGAVLVILRLALILVLLIGQRLIAWLRHVQIGLRTPLAEIGGEVENAELGIILHGDEERAAIRREVEQLRVIDSRDPVGQLQCRDIDDVDGIAVTTGNEDPRPCRFELQVPWPRRSTDTFHHLQRPAVQNMDGIVLLARNEDQTGILRSNRQGQPECQCAPQRRAEQPTEDHVSSPCKMPPADRHRRALCFSCWE